MYVVLALILVLYVSHQTCQPSCIGCGSPHNKTFEASTHALHYINSQGEEVLHSVLSSTVLFQEETEDFMHLLDSDLNEPSDSDMEVSIMIIAPFR